MSMNNNNNMNNNKSLFLKRIALRALNNCPVVQDPKNIAYHEEDCQFRDVECPKDFCKDFIPQSTLGQHLISHAKVYATAKKCLNGIALVTPQFTKDVFDAECDYRWLLGPIDFNGKSFLVQVNHDHVLRHVCFWVQMIGSKFEAKNFKYKIQLQENDEYGSPTYKGPVKSLDDSKTKVFKSKIGLNVPSKIIKKYLKDDSLTLQVKFKDLKPKDDEDDQDSMASNDGD